MSTVRMADESDVAKIVKWSVCNSDKNGFDPSVLLYPTTDVLAVENGTGPLLYLPVQLVGMVESLAPSPQASPDQLRWALLRAMQHLVEQGKARGLREIYFLGSDDGLAEQATRIGFVKCDWPAYKLRIGGAE